MAINYSADPAYQAWLASLGFLETTAKQGAADQQHRIGQMHDFQKEGLFIDRDMALRGVSSNYENRGLIRSGEHERSRAETLRDSNRRLGGLELQTANQQGDVSARLARDLADQQMRNSSAQFDAATRLGMRAGRGY